jgi:hypothetical protein
MVAVTVREHVLVLVGVGVGATVVVATVKVGDKAGRDGVADRVVDDDFVGDEVGGADSVGVIEAV